MAESRVEILQMNLDEEASVLEICNEMSRGLDDQHGRSEIREWLTEALKQAAEAGEIGFFIDEFGATDIRDISPEEGLVLLQTDDIWSAESETMLHVYRLQE